MALDLKVQYPSQVDVGNPSYPFGQPRNVSAPAATDGTPWEQALVRDIYGVLQKLLQDAGLTPDGNPDSALSSQYLDAMELLFLNRTELRANGGVILHNGNSLESKERNGLTAFWSTTTLELTDAGSARDAFEASDIILPLAFGKRPGSTWVVGDGNGGLPDALTPTNLWLRKFLVGRPSGASDICWDTNTIAANFFADANAIAAGFSDSTLFRRIGWTYINSDLTVPIFLTDLDDPGRYIWATPIRNLITPVIGTASRSIHTLELVPPKALGLLSVHVEHSEDATYLMTASDQADVPPGPSRFTVRLVASALAASLPVTIRVNDSSQILLRKTAAGSTTAFDVIVEGWIDNGVAP